MVQNLSLSLVSQLMPRSTSGFDFTQLFPGSSGSGTGAVYGVGSVATALQQAEKNEAKQLEQVAKQPDVQKALARYAKVVASATSMEEVLDDPVARHVFLKANGLSDMENYTGLAKKALTSDLLDPKSVAIKLANVNGKWAETVKNYNVALLGIGVLKVSDAIKQVSDDYIAEKRLDLLDQQLPGLGSAVLFKKVAASLDTPIKILGSALGREVVTTAFGIPREIALQSYVAQEKAITQRMDPKKLAQPAFVEKVVQRYLIQLNGGVAGLTA